MNEETQKNPDVLECLANLSSDEVFTPPKIVNQMLDLLPKEIWSNPKITFLDPVCKSGVFLREITKRLMRGLANAIPDESERRNHIFENQVFGIGITELTSLISRRTVYCTKKANGEFSICSKFKDEQGNIIFTPMKHTWEGNHCFCGANKSFFDRPDDYESHAYMFIHTEKPEDLFNMKFDVIIGNPPYQLSDGGNKASAKPIYQLFVRQAMKLQPRYITMITPARWYSGGKGLDTFRDEMLSDDHIREIHDYFDSNDCFPGVDISGGVSYFLWERDNPGLCKVVNHYGDDYSEYIRPLLEENSDTFIRFNKAIPILRKIQQLKEKTFDTHISSRKPFGISTDVSVLSKPDTDTIPIYAYPKDGYVLTSEITQGKEYLDNYNVMVSYAYGERGKFPYLVLGKPFIGERGRCCSETYIVLGSYKTKNEAENVITYIKTKLFRFLVLLKKNTQHATKNVYSFVPEQDYTKSWTDQELYKKYGIIPEEIEYIESMVRPMTESELND